MINFASDNASGAHPAVMEALCAANAGNAKAYGDDAYTAAAISSFKNVFGDDIVVHFVLNGTGANVLSLASVAKPYHAVICADIAHINVDETGAPENVVGCKLLTVPTATGKITPEDVAPFLAAKGVMHHSQPKVISITQTTEVGAVYTPEEVKALADFAHANNMYLHMDGARIANAAAALGVDVAQFTRDAGVDVLSFGGTKNGMAFGEAVVFFDAALGEDFEYLRKQNLQLLSKMRYLTCQFPALLDSGLWLKNASHANAMAKRLGTGLQKLEHVEVTNDVQANAVFAVLSAEHIAALQEQFYFYIWDERKHEVRLVCSFDTREEEVDAFIRAAAALM